MTDVSKLNGTKAGFIARQLDAKDGAQDGKIKASIWNDFIKEIGTGKKINEFISTENAMKSITTYVIRQAKNLEKNISKLAEEWSNKIGNTADVNPAGETSNPEEVDREEVVENPEVETATTQTKILPNIQTLCEEQGLTKEQFQLICRKYIIEEQLKSNSKSVNKVALFSELQNITAETQNLVKAQDIMKIYNLSVNELKKLNMSIFIENNYKP